MTTPVISDKTPSLNAERRSALRTREAEQPPRPQGNQAEEPQQAESAASTLQPDVERAARLYRAESGGPEPSGDAIRSESEARSVLTRLREQLVRDPAAALRAMGGADSSLLSTLERIPA